MIERLPPTLDDWAVHADRLLARGDRVGEALNRLIREARRRPEYTMAVRRYGAHSVLAGMDVRELWKRLHRKKVLFDAGHAHHALMDRIANRLPMRRPTPLPLP